jgi:hypothetical protein
MKIGLIVLLIFFSSLVIFSIPDDEKPSEASSYGKWEVIAQFGGGGMEFSEYESFDLDKESITINTGTESVLGYKSDENQVSSDEFGMLAWYKEGSADGTQSGVPIMALRLKVKGKNAILKIRIGSDPIRDFQFEESEEMETIIFVLRKAEP